MSESQESQQLSTSRSLGAFLKEARAEGYSDNYLWELARKEFPVWRDENAWTCVATLRESATTPSSMTLSVQWVQQVRRGSDLYCGLVIKKFTPLLKAARKEPAKLSPASFVTLTSNPSSKSREESIETIEHAWNILLTIIRRRHPHIEFYKVVELTPNSALVHMHILFFKIAYIPKEWLSKTWERLHGAPIVHIEQVRNLEHVILYLLKHQRKVMADDESMSYFWFHKKRAWTTSRNLWSIVEGILGVDLTYANPIQTEDEYLLGFRVISITFEEGKDPPDDVDIHLSREEMTRIRAYDRPELVDYLQSELMDVLQEHSSDIGFDLEKMSSGQHTTQHIDVHEAKCGKRPSVIWGS
jgi:hypothetical protein